MSRYQLRLGAAGYEVLDYGMTESIGWVVASCTSLEAALAAQRLLEGNW